MIFKNPHRSLDPETFEYIRSLARDHTPSQIAKRLNEEGIKPKRSDSYNSRSLTALFRVLRLNLRARGGRTEMTIHAGTEGIRCSPWQKY